MLTQGLRPLSQNGKIIIRTHDRKAFASCLQQWHWASPLQRNLESRMPQKALWFGTGGHDSLAAHYHPDPAQRQDAVEFWINWCESERKRIRLQAEKSGMSWDWEEEYQELKELGIEVLTHYKSWAPSADGNYGDDKFIVRGVEMEFEVPVKDPDGNPVFALDRDGNSCPVVYQGRCDGLVEDQYGRYYLLEHKFYHPNQFSQGSQENHLILDEQCTSYAWGLQEQIGKPIGGILFNMIKKKEPTKAKELKTGGLSQRADLDSTFTAYRQQLVEYYGRIGQPVPWANYAKMLNILKAKGGSSNPFFRRIPVRRNQMELRNASLRIWAQVQKMIDPGYIYPTPDAMKCKFCSFTSACVAALDGSDPEYILENRFQQRPRATDKGQSSASDDIWGF